MINYGFTQVINFKISRFTQDINIIFINMINGQVGRANNELLLCSNAQLHTDETVAH